MKNLAAIADPSSNSTDTSSCEDSDEDSTVPDTSSSAGTDGKADADNENKVTGVTAIIAKLVHNKANSQSSSLTQTPVKEHEKQLNKSNIRQWF